YGRPRTGSVTLGARPLTRWGPRVWARRIAVVTQDAPTGFDFTALEVVLMGRSPHLSLLGVESAHDTAVALGAMKQTRTDALAGRPLGALSGGERQRVLLARARAQETPIPLSGEPTSHLHAH